MSGAPHRLAVRVYYEDTDFSGVVYHANYLRFLERGRTEFLRAAGIDQSALFSSEPPLGFAVARIAVDFRRPARMDDLLEVETALASAGGASLVMGQRVLRGTEVLVEAEVRVAAVSGGRAVRLPRGLAERLKGGAASLTAP